MVRNYQGTDSVDAIIDFLDGQSHMTHEERILETAKYRISKILELIDDNDIATQHLLNILSPHEASDGDIDTSDLLAVADALAPHCANYFISALPPPPFYASRIAVILRESGDYDREKQFLISWCRHFSTCPGSGFRKLMDRLLAINK